MSMSCQYSGIFIFLINKCHSLSCLSDSAELATLHQQFLAVQEKAQFPVLSLVDGRPLRVLGLPVFLVPIHSAGKEGNSTHAVPCCGEGVVVGGLVCHV